MTAISIQGVSKRFILETDRASSIKEAFLRRGKPKDNEFWALRDVSFDIPKGSFFGIIGHNGSGKSTILRLMAGIHMPTEGSIVTNGRISALLELGSGFHPDLTGRENIFLNGAMLGLDKRQMTEAVDEIIEFSGIGEFIDAPVKIYSSGMQVRLGFAVAVHVQPEILLVDEVLAVGDEAFQRKCLDHIHTLRRKGVTIVLVAHSPQMMQTMCDEVAWLDHGELQTVGNSVESIGAYIRHVNTLEAERIAKAQALEAAKVAETPAAEADVVGADDTPSSDGTPAEGTGSDTEESPSATSDPGKLDGIDPDRRGSGELRVQRLEYLDGSGATVETATAGDPFVIRIWYELYEAIDGPTFGLGVYTDLGVHVAAVNDRLYNVIQPDLEPGVGSVDIRFDRLILLPGTYFMTTGIYTPDQMHCYDSWHQVHKLVVQPGSSPEHSALVELQADYQHAVRVGDLPSP